VRTARLERPRVARPIRPTTGLARDLSSSCLVPALLKEKEEKAWRTIRGKYVSTE